MRNISSRDPLFLFTPSLLLAVLLPFQGTLRGEIPLSLFSVPEGLEVTLWAQSPLVRNPTNMDVDAAGRIWVTEGVNYRGHYNRQPEGDRVVILEDTDGDGIADSSSVFVQEEALRAPLGIAVLDNKIVVSMAPDLIVYTDVNRNLRFDPGTDTREVLLTGFNGHDHDHSLHSVTVGPDGLWYWNVGNCGALFTDRSGKTFRIGSSYKPGTRRAGPDPTAWAGQASDDGHVYVGGFAARMNPDGTWVEIIGHNFRNSYEQTITSWGDVFQNDNDDPPACRTSFLMEYGNAGFSSADGQRSWQADRRPGQSTPIAEWRQEDPGTMPPGDVYGGGSPTGIAYYENGALGEMHQGLLLSCEAARNVVFGYYPKANGAGFTLERFDFLTTNKENDFAGTDFKGGGRSVTGDTKTLFRPSDVMVGPDGAVYVSDWFDPRVGGHQDLDDTVSGAIYRVAPKGFRSTVPKFDLDTPEGQIQALKSPAVNVRNLGRERLLAQGSQALPYVKKLLENSNPYLRARAIWMLPHLGCDGESLLMKLTDHTDPKTRIAAFRTLRRAKQEVLTTAQKLAADPSPAVRREVALAMRDVPWEESKDILLAVAEGYDGEDRSYLEAFGTGCTGKEEMIYPLLHHNLGQSDPIQWSKAFAGLAWRLSSPSALSDFAKRAASQVLPPDQRKEAMVAIGFMPSRDAAQSMIDLANQTAGTDRANALWWLLNRKDNLWKDHGIMNELKAKGLYDPDTIQLISIVTPPAPTTPNYSASDILKLNGIASRGKIASARCYICHRIEGNGVDFGPDLSAYGKTQTREVVANAIINPSSDIAHGFDGYEIVTQDDLRIQGVILSNGDPVIMNSMGGVTQTIPASKIKSKKRLDQSLMMVPIQLGLTAQDIADLVAYLQSITP